MRLEHEFTYRTTVKGPAIVGEGPFGSRHHYEMLDGSLEGVRLKGRVCGAAADWMLVGQDGFMRMDVRFQLLTDDGAVLLVRYSGPAEANAKLGAALTAGEATSFDDQLIRTVWWIESGDPRYTWVNGSVFVGEGRACPANNGKPGFEHRVYHVA